MQLEPNTPMQMPYQLEPDVSQPTKDQKNCPNTGVPSRYTKIGIGLILLSGVLWFSLFAVPFLPFTTGKKALLAGAVFIGVQIAWWTGATLAGPRVVRKVTGWMRRSK